MKNWFDSLQPRERASLLIGSVMLSIFLLYSAIWAPLSRKTRTLEASITNKEKSLRQMQETSQKILALMEKKSGHDAQSGLSLISIVDSRFTETGLKATIDRMEPDGDTSVKLWLVRAAFDDLTRTLGKLEAENNIRIKSLSANPTDVTGRVDARVVLTTQ